MSHSTLDNPVAHSCQWDPGAAARAASIWALSRLMLALLPELAPYGLRRWLVLLARGICNPCWARPCRCWSRSQYRHRRCEGPHHRGRAQSSVGRAPTMRCPGLFCRRTDRHIGGCFDRPCPSASPPQTIAGSGVVVRLQEGIHGNSLAVLRTPDRPIVY